MRARFFATLLFLAASMVSGCSVQQATTAAPAIAQAPAHPLPFKGHLAEGDANAVPPAVAMSLASDSQVTFIYREELTHDDYHVPLIVTAFDPVTYAGAPVGDLGVTAFASLSITDGERVLGDYTAKVHVSKSYTLYREPTHREVEEAARAAVREKIDQKLYRDEDRLAQAFAVAGQPTADASQPGIPASGTGQPAASAAVASRPAAPAADQ
ncbi:MAG TPA: hypothetical protein VL393_08705 [Candidatus Binataceae bacterium]|nr:hypothetical protein [Candidatus Binataceae bacterium]